MKRTPVTSSRILSIGWANNIMEVEFKGGSVYRYFDIPQETYKKIMDSESPGKALQPIIDNKEIKFQKVTPETL